MDTDLLNELTSGSSIESVWEVFASAMAEYGFDRLIYGYTRFSTDRSLGNVEDAVILTRHDSKYVDMLIAQEMYKKGPMIRWAAENTGACSWSYIHQEFAQGRLSPEELEMMAINQAMEVTAGYTISFNDQSSRSKGALGLTAKRGLSQADVDEIWTVKGNEIELISKVMHLKIIQLPNMNMRQGLTERQSQVLEWIADGKTIRDTATIMDLNPATVEKHLRLVRERLGVETTAQAILKASSQNQFFLVDYDNA